MFHQESQIENEGPDKEGEYRPEQNQDWHQ